AWVIVCFIGIYYVYISELNGELEEDMNTHILKVGNEFAARNSEYDAINPQVNAINPSLNDKNEPEPEIKPPIVKCTQDKKITIEYNGRTLQNDRINDIVYCMDGILVLNDGFSIGN